MPERRSTWCSRSASAARWAWTTRCSASTSSATPTASRCTSPARTGAGSPRARSSTSRPTGGAGGHGLYSTPRDYVRFERALLRGGELDGERILTQETVDAAFTNQIGDLDFPEAIATADPASTADFNAGPGYKWGYGLLLNTEDIPGMRRAYSGAWAGLLNTHFWVDRTTGVAGSIYSAFLPFVTPEAFQLYQDFEQALYASL